MSPSPLYRAEDVKSAYHLHYTWSGWPATGCLPSMPDLSLLALAWESDGLRLLECNWEDRQVQLAFSARPNVSPMLLATRAKGRLQYLLRDRGFPGFSRKVAVRSVGENRSADIERYVNAQVTRAGFVDPRFRESIQALTEVCADAELERPTEVRRGRYWYNLHMVFVVESRASITHLKTLATIHDGVFRIAAKNRCRVAAISVMPDHLHMALRGSPEKSPQDLAMSMLNNLAFLLGQAPVWSKGYYAGTFSEYDMGAVRASLGNKGSAS